MKNKIFDVLLWCMTLLFIASVLTMPDTIPMHWNSQWEVDGYGSRYFFILIALIPVFVYYGMKITKTIDPNKNKILAREKTYDIVRKAMSIVFMGLVGFMYYITMNPTIDGTMGIGIILGIMFIVIGNFMPKFPQNYFLGIRTPWTLSNEEVWKKTHRFGGYAFVICGAFNIVTALIYPKAVIIILLMSVVVEGGVTLIYSYKVYKQLESKNIDNKSI